MSGRSNGSQLLEYLAAVTIFLNHPRYATCLTLNTPDTS
jgi:hypothetical protein